MVGGESIKLKWAGEVTGEVTGEVAGVSSAWSVQFSCSAPLQKEEGLLPAPVYLPVPDQASSQREQVKA